MASLLNFTEAPNLLELAEAYRNDLPAIWGHAPCADDPNQLSLAELSLCADDSIQSVCADEGPPADPSVCADETPSDVRLKTDIEQIGTTVYGLPLYHFRYKTGTERFEGVMAQDVLEVMPDAVVKGEDGYYRVKYGQLGIRMTRA